MTKKVSLKSKNILYVTHSYNNFIKFQVEILAKQFKHVYVLVRHKPITALSKVFKIPELKFHSKEYKIDVRDTPTNITVIPVPLWYLPFDWFYRRLGKWHLKGVLKIIRKLNIEFDLVHAHMLWSAGFVGMQLAKQYNVPFIVTGHGSDVYVKPFIDKWWRRSITDVLKSADEIITVSQNNLRIIKELGIKQKVHVIPNGFDTHKYKNVDKSKLRKTLGLSVKKEVFLTVANLEKVKGHEVLLDSIRLLGNRSKKLLFVWVGGGTLFTKLKQQIKNKQLEDLVVMTDFKQHEDVVKYELAADYFVLPSYNEGVPTVMFEALAAGTPFISTKVGGIPEIARDFTGILIEPGNSLALKEAIVKALEMKWSRAKIQSYSKEFTWENICKKIASIYKKLC